ncbi:MAG: WecB/TagA/CpsF family glycosyltransferase [Nanoarchaeota archaeon]|nr:WecB/TagA/CpsF family glycosyltransferase [Nanoarchaeota archaeon]
MKQKLTFQDKNEKELFKFLKSNKERKILSFLNQHDLYQLNNEPLFKEALLKKYNLNFIDGSTISVYLSLTNLRKIPRIRGPTFTKDFLSEKNLSKNKRHFFIGLEKKDIQRLKKKLPHLNNTESYNPPFIKFIQFSQEEIKKMSKLINKYKADYVWVGIGCPKQNILTDTLFRKTKAQYFVNIGAGLDFLLEKKKEAPSLVRKLGIEWLYRLVTDFKHTFKKVDKSFISLIYLPGQIKINKPET